MAVKLPDTTSGSITFENILSVRPLELENLKVRFSGYAQHN